MMQGCESACLAPKTWLSPRVPSLPAPSGPAEVRASGRPPLGSHQAFGGWRRCQRRAGALPTLGGGHSLLPAWGRRCLAQPLLPGSSCEVDELDYTARPPWEPVSGRASMASREGDRHVSTREPLLRPSSLGRCSDAAWALSSPPGEPAKSHSTKSTAETLP